MKFSKLLSSLTGKKKVVLKVGVVGYSAQKFDVDHAKELVRSAFDQVEKLYPEHVYDCVSGLTDLGIPGIAYREAEARGWRTTGVACDKAKEHKLFPVDKKIIHGKEWGDESPVFLSMIDVLVRIGGGFQSHREAARAIRSGKKVIELDLDSQ